MDGHDLALAQPDEATMPPPGQSLVPSVDNDGWMATYEAEKKLQAERSTALLRRIWGQLERAGITAVTVEFDGAGDDGQMGTITATGATGTIAINESTLDEDETTRTTGNEINEGPRSLESAIEDACYAVLEHLHDGWENNDGAYGEFTLDVVSRALKLEYNSRYTEIATTTHHWESM